MRRFSTPFFYMGWGVVWCNGRWAGWFASAKELTRLGVFPPRVDRGAKLVDEELDRVEPAPRCGHMEGRLPRQRVLDVDARALGDEPGDNVEVTVVAGEVDGAVAVLVHRLVVGAALDDEPLNRGEVPHRRGDVQRRHAVRALHVDLRVAVHDKDAEEVEVARHGRARQRREGRDGEVRPGEVGVCAVREQRVRDLRLAEAARVVQAVDLVAGHLRVDIQVVVREQPVDRLQQRLFLAAVVRVARREDGHRQRGVVGAVPHRPRPRAPGNQPLGRGQVPVHAREIQRVGTLVVRRLGFDPRPPVHAERLERREVASDRRDVDTREHARQPVLQRHLQLPVDNVPQGPHLAFVPYYHVDKIGASTTAVGKPHDRKPA